MKECQPLLRGDAHVLAQEAGAVPPQPQGRGSHSSTSQLNLSAFCVTRGVQGVFMAGVEGVFRRLWDVLGVRNGSG